ncbi:MAG: glycosyl hydrolase family 18 protein [Gammaproteobacteria bacterium]|nr:glycosyl hydrolase family 18 protein [Gammaproteobacteria bacterium]
MKKIFIIVSSICLFYSAISLAGTPFNKQITIGYYASWDAYNGFPPDKIPVANLDVINYAFGTIDKNTCEVKLLDPNIDEKNFAALQVLKNNNPHLKVLYSVGGWNNSNGFYYCTLLPEKTKILADSIKKFLLNHPVLDGVDLDWEFPVAGGCNSAYETCRDGGQQHAPGDGDRQAFVDLVKKIRTAIGGDKYLTIAGPAVDGKTVMNSSINNLDLKNMIPYLDFINIMAYDYHGAWETRTGNLAPLYRDAYHGEDAEHYNIDDAVNAYIKYGVPANKLVMGFPLYGLEWANVADGGTHGLYQTATVIQNNHPLYKDIRARDWNNVFQDPLSKSMMYFKNGIFTTFDGPETLKVKSSYIKDKRLLGTMFWEVSNDSCDKNALIYQMSSALGRAGTKTYACPPPVPNNKLQVTINGATWLDAITIIDGASYYPLQNGKYKDPNAWGPKDDIVFDRDSGSTIANLEGKTGLKVQITRYGVASKCKDGKGGAFDFTKYTHIQVNGDNLACQVD